MDKHNAWRVRRDPNNKQAYQVFSVEDNCFVVVNKIFYSLASAGEFTREANKMLLARIKNI